MSKPIHIEAKTIADAWFQLLYNIFDNSYIQTIQKGSFEKEQYRLQYPGVSIFIEYPWMDMIPHMPAGSNIPAPTTMEYVEDYFANYLMDPNLAENETYRYSSRIHYPMPKGGSQLERVIDMLKKTPLTNQAVVEIATPTDLDICIGKDGKCDPACLRILDWKTIPVKTDKKHGEEEQNIQYITGPDGTLSELTLTLSVYFRSWDLWAGLPSNLAGLELLKQYVAGETGLKNGPMYAYSAGLHIYGYQEDLARIRTLKNGK